MGIPLALFGSISAIRSAKDETFGWLALGLVAVAVLIILRVVYVGFFGADALQTAGL